ncbi:MAG: serpin family protein [Actinomycetota bacterium]
MRRLTIAIVALALLAASCGGEVAATGSDFISSDLPRALSDAPPADVAAVAAAEQAFAADLYAVLAAGDENLVFSPLSVHLALAMALGGAQGETATQMEGALRVAGIDPARLHAALNGLDAALTSRNLTEPPVDDREQKVQVSVVNSLWGQEGFAFLSEYLDLLATNYGAGIRLVDFQTAAEEARVAINDWVAAQTNDRITDLIPQGAIDALTRLVLVNAVYLDATWAAPFSHDATSDAPFTLLDGTEVTVPTMHQSLSTLYGEGDGWRAIDLPYTGGELSLLVVMPDDGRFDEVEAALSAGLLEQVRASLAASEVSLSLPKFEIRTQTGLSEALQGLGMIDAFDPNAADFSGISTADQLYVSDVIHEAFIAVDEDGTEAAAATAVIIGTTSAPVSMIELNVDHPFLFFLQDRATGAVLFVGRVMSPQ